MANQLRIFKICIVAASVLAAAVPLTDLVEPTLVFSLHRDAPLAQSPEGWTQVVAAAGYATILALGLGAISAVGLILLRRWARPLASVAAAVLLLAHLPVGEMSYSGGAFALALASYGLWMWALSMAYFSSVSLSFR